MAENNIVLPAGFVEDIKSLLGNEAEDLLKSLNKPPCVSVRINKRKPGAFFKNSKSVKWCGTGYYLPERPIFTLDPMLHAGAYYVQDASSMIYETVAAKLITEFEKETVLKESGTQIIRVLDLCAAPGGKTTAIINSLPDSAEITANEINTSRHSILKENLAKWGFPNTRIFNKDSAFFADQGEYYDIVAVDAPCSGEGMMRKDSDAIKQWSPGLIEKCSLLQKDILRNAVSSLKEGGFLIYSTCTFNRKENEENAEFIRSELGMSPYDPSFPTEWNIPRGIGTDLPVYRFMPHLTEGEGLFLAVFRKPGNRMPFFKTKNYFFTKKSIAKDSAPEIEDILSVDFKSDAFPKVELSREQALTYLRRETFMLDSSVPKGYVVVTFNNLPLGLVKNIGTRANNLYPKNWRIRI